MDVDPPTDGCHRWFYHVWPISSGHSRFFRKFLNQSSTFRFHKGTIGNGHSWGHLDGLQDINYFQEEGSSLSWFCWIPEDTKKQAEGWKTAIIQPCIFPWFVELYQQNTLWGKTVCWWFLRIETSWLLEFTRVCPNVENHGKKSVKLLPFLCKEFYFSCVGRLNVSWNAGEMMKCGQVEINTPVWLCWVMFAILRNTDANAKSSFGW